MVRIQYSILFNTLVFFCLLSLVVIEALRFTGVH